MSANKSMRQPMVKIIPTDSDTLLEAISTKTPVLVYQVLASQVHYCQEIEKTLKIGLCLGHNFQASEQLTYALHYLSLEKAHFTQNLDLIHGETEGQRKNQPKLGWYLEQVWYDSV